MNNTSGKYSPAIKLILRPVLLFAALMAMAFAAHGQTLRSHIDAVPESYNFWVYTPSMTQGAKMKPLVIFLHGASLSGRDLNKVLRYGTLDAISRGLNIDAYVLAPQTPGRAWSPSRVMRAVDYLIDQHPDIDTSRVYVAGMSLGGYGALDLANAYPHRIAAALAFCGGCSSTDVSGLSEVPTWIVHGIADRAVPVSMSDRVAEALADIDPETPRLIYDRVPGMGHGGPARYFYMPKFYEWLFQHSIDDYERPMAEPFEVTDVMVRNVYRDLEKRQPLITVPDAEPEKGIIFLPAGFDDAFPLPPPPSWQTGITGF